VKVFPLQLGEFSKDPLRAALKSECAPRFVAGYFADVIEHIQKGIVFLSNEPRRNQSETQIAGI
jgi:hypothetical protein